MWRTAATGMRHFAARTSLKRRQMFSQSGGSNDTSSSTGRDTKRYALAGAALFVSGGLAARWWYSRLLLNDNSDTTRGFRKDASRATVVLQNVPRPAAPLSQKGLDSAKYHELKQVDAAQFQAFVQEQRQLLRQTAAENQEKSAQLLHDKLRASMADADHRVDAFCDWYLSYATTYKLLGIAMSSAARHALSVHNNQQQTLTERVTSDLETVVGRQYDAMVLRPALTDPSIHRATVETLQQAHRDYWTALEALDAALAEFVTINGYDTPPTHSSVVLELDWAAQRQKVQHVPAAYDKSPERTVALIAGGAAAGKLAGGAATVAAVKALAAKLSAPLASKAVAATLSGKAAAGAASGAVLGGPVGAAAGAAVGLGVDVGVNAVTGLLQRSALREDVRASLRATVDEWEQDVLRPEVERVQRVWYQHAQDMLGGGGGADEAKPATAAAAVATARPTTDEPES